MQIISETDIKNLYIPPKDSHKGQNGRLLIIGGSKLFHAASLWALQVASRIVDLIHYSSIDANNKIVQKLKEEFRNGIIVPRSDIEEYIREDDVILIGPGMVRANSSEIFNFQFSIFNLENILKIRNEGLQTYYLTKYLLQKYPQKKWVIDAGALQMLDLKDIPKKAILTPHHGEFELLKSKISRLSGINDAVYAHSSQTASGQNPNDKSNPKSKIQNLIQEDQVKEFANEYHCVVLLKGEKDVISDGQKVAAIEGGNAGMTKGGTGDVLAGLIAALYCNNDAWTATIAGSYINKKAGDDLFKTKGFWFNASDLADQIPETMRKLFLKQLKSY